MRTAITILFILTIIISGCQPAAVSEPVESPQPTNPILLMTSTAASTEVPTETSTPSATDTPTPKPTVNNHLPPEEWKNWPVVPETTDRVLEIYQNGVALGNDPHHFSKIGDCHNVKEAFMGLFDKPGWYLLRGENAHLQPAIDWFAGSFNRDGYAVKGGYNAAAELSPIWADKEVCLEGENPVECELRVHNPSFAIVSLELWWEGRTTERYETYMRKILDTLIENGVVPVLVTKVDNLEGDNSLNYTTAKLAYEYNLPMFNFWRAAQSLPNGGMDIERNDGFHISTLAWTERSFLALRTLDVLWNSVQ